MWVTGPPGAGKTVLVASWIARTRMRSVWLQLDAGDGDPAAFFYWLARAAPAATRRRLPRFGPEYLGDPAAFGRRFARALFSASRAGSVLVLDDWSEVKVDAPLRGVIRELLAEIPAGIGVVVTSRAEPPPELARLRASGALELVDGEALALTPSEAVAVARLRGASVPPETLVARTRGWAAGVALLAAAANDADVDRSSPGAVFDFFSTEVFERAPRAVQGVLLRVSLAPRIAASKAARLAADASAPEVLADLARRGWFTQRHVSGAETAYQLHPLFREFLAARARRALGEEAYRSLAFETARVMEESGDAAGAVALFREAGAFKEIARIVVTRAPKAFKAGAARTLLDWIELLPPGLLEANPWLLHWRAAARVLISPERALPDAERAFDLFLRAGDAAGAYAAWAGAVHVIMYGTQHDHAAVDRWLGELARVRAAFPAWPAREVEAAVASAALAAYALHRPWDAAIAEWEERAAEIALSPGEPRMRLDAGIQVLLRDGLGGANVRRACVVIDALRPVLADDHASPFDVITWAVAETFHAINAGDSEGARAIVTRGLDVGAQHDLHHWDSSLLAGRLLAELAEDQLARAAKTCAQLARAARGGPRLPQVAYHSAACMLGIRRGDPRGAVEHGRVAVALATEAGSVLPAANARVGYALALERTGTPALDEALRVVREGGIPHCAYGALLAIATVALARGDERAAVRAVEDGFAVGERTGCHWASWLSRAELAELCALALEHGIATGFVAETIRACRLVPGPRARHVPQWPWSTRVEALGGLALRRDGREPPQGKAQRKPLELLRLLVAHGERGATLDRLAEALWPDADGDTAHHALETTMYRLRRLLGDPGAVVRRGGRASLDPDRVFVDAWAVESLVARAEALRVRGDAAEALRASTAAIDLYRGDLLPDDDLPAIDAPRARLRERMNRLAALRQG